MNQDIICHSEVCGEEIVYELASKVYKGNSISAADKLLGDFRKNMYGASSLEAPPKIKREPKVTIKSDDVDLEEKVESLDIGKGNYEGW